MVKEEEICKKLELIDVDKQDLTEGNSSDINIRNRKLRSPLDRLKNLNNWGINMDSKERVIPKIKILSEVEDENGSVTSLISMPCNSEVTDDGGNIWSLEGKYVLECGEPHVFQYVLERMSTLEQHCVKYDPKFNKEWEGYTDKKTYKCHYNVPCCTCNVEGKVSFGAYRCPTKNLTFEKCYWKDSGGVTLTFNGELIPNVTIDPVLTVGPHLQTPYGFWRNETSAIVLDAFHPYLEQTNFNYSCEMSNSPCGRESYFIWKTMLSVDPQPQLVECTTVLAVPFRVNPENMKYCEIVQVLRNIDTQGIGISSMIGDCVIKVKDYNANIFDCSF
jgi:hypothetical protein